MGIQIKMRTRSSEFLLQVPGQGEIRIGDPILQVCAAPMEDLSDLSLIDQLPGKGNRRHPAVVMIKVVHNTGFFSRLVHFLGVRVGQGDRLLTKDMLPVFGGRDRDLFVEKSRCNNIDHIDIRSLDDFTPIRFTFLPAPIICEIMGTVIIRIACHLHNRLQPQMEKLGCLAPGITMRFAHEPHPDNCHIYCFQVSLSFRNGFPGGRRPADPGNLWFNSMLWQSSSAL